MFLACTHLRTLRLRPIAPLLACTVLTYTLLLQAIFGFKHLAALELIWLLCNLDLAFSFRSPTTMAEAHVDAAAQPRRGVVRNCLDDQGRNTRQRVDDLETRMDAAEAQGHSHETRLLFLSSSFSGSSCESCPQGLYCGAGVSQGSTW